MNLSKRKKYLILIGVCGIALLVDKLFLPNSRPAVALADLVITGDSKAQVGKSPAMPPNLPVPEIPFPKAVKPLDPSERVRDVFTQARISRPESVAVSTKPAADRAPPDSLTADQFSAKYKLTGILLDAQLKIAVLDSQWVEEGMTIEGCKLAQLSTNQATFDCYDRKAVLELYGSIDHQQSGPKFVRPSAKK